MLRLKVRIRKKRSSGTHAYAFAEHVCKSFGALRLGYFPGFRLGVRPYLVQEGFDSGFVRSVILEGVTDTLETIIEILQRTFKFKDVCTRCWRRCGLAQS